MVVRIIASQQEGPGFNFQVGRALHVLHVSVCVSSRCSPQSSKTRIRVLSSQCPWLNVLMQIWIWCPGAAQQLSAPPRKRMHQMQRTKFTLHHAHVKKEKISCGVIQVARRLSSLIRLKKEVSAPWQEPCSPMFREKLDCQVFRILRWHHKGSMETYYVLAIMTIMGFHRIKIGWNSEPPSPGPPLT